MEQGHNKGREPGKTSDYLLPSYWNDRFRDEKGYEWFKGYEEFKHLLLPHLCPGDKILILGCGNSSLTLDLWRDGFKDITSIDLSEVVIDKMRSHAEREGAHSLKWEVADMLALPFGDAEFDKVLEKGTMDVLFVDNDSPWDPKPAVVQRVHRMLAETHRVLKADGMFISVTFAQPHFRGPFFSAPQYDWGVKHTAFGETFHYFVYQLHRGQKDPNDHKAGCEYNPSKFALNDGTTHEYMDTEDYLLNMEI